MRKLHKIASSLFILVITFTVFAVNVSAANTTNNYSLPTLNAVFSTSSTSAASNVATTSRSSTYRNYNVYRIEVTGTITTSVIGVENYLRVYNATYGVIADIPLPPSGSVSGTTAYVLTDVPLEGTWQVQLISYRSSSGSIGATTLSNGRVKFFCTY